MTRCVCRIHQAVIGDIKTCHCILKTNRVLPQLQELPLASTDTFSRHVFHFWWLIMISMMRVTIFLHGFYDKIKVFSYLTESFCKIIYNCGNISFVTEVPGDFWILEVSDTSVPSYSNLIIEKICGAVNCLAGDAIKATRSARMALIMVQRRGSMRIIPESMCSWSPHAQW